MTWLWGNWIVQPVLGHISDDHLAGSGRLEHLGVELADGTGIDDDGRFVGLQAHVPQ